MKPLKIEEVVNAIDGRMVRTGKVHEITGVSTDSRTIRPGELFVPLIGERFNGHSFIDAAAAKGASAVLTQELNIRFPEGIHVIYTNDTLKALQNLAGWYLNSFRIPVAAVTGSTGKTTTKDMIACVLSQRYKVLKTQGNFNNEIGLPLTLFNLDDTHQMAVLEMGMSDFGEISRLVGIAPPKAAVITNIGVSHIEKLGSRENILKAKLEIFQGFDDSTTAIINDDDDMLHKAADSFTFPVIRFGTKPSADIVATNIRLAGEKGVEYTVETEGNTFPVRLKVPGMHNVYNSLAAVAMGRVFGLTYEEIQRGLLRFETDSMRLNIVHMENDIVMINDSYNASPDSMTAALRVLGDMEGKRRIAILGDMLELGDYSEEAHREVGAAAVACGIDVLAVKGSHSLWIAEEAVKAGLPSTSVYRFNDNAEIKEWLGSFLAEGDRILIKGSRGMRMEEVAAYLQDGGIQK
ncbi:MAG TPA: UDP-N-acetylmuramoyl-tripeptide--D-alanyl-D-alanine ligase [Candidatus Atribacteria bacterium]|nr:UDP-N-acetylmuramoyl-tripeptide--D-alanyl-D-alanine ligase [Candidatus Atribacteria bacterium]